MKPPITQSQAWAVIAESAGWNGKELPELPELEYRLSPDSEPSLYDPYDMQAYGAACAAHARGKALEEAKQACRTVAEIALVTNSGELARKTSTTAESCANAIEALKGK